MLTLSEETESLAHRLAEEQKRSVDEVVRRALEHQAHAAMVIKPVPVARISEEEVAARRVFLRDIQRQIAALPTLDPRPIEEIFDEINEL